MTTTPATDRIALSHTRAETGWGAAVWKGLVVLIASFLGFVIVPDRLVSYLSLHVAPDVRDALGVVWWIAFLVFLSWLFVRLQRRASG